MAQIGEQTLLHIRRPQLEIACCGAVAAALKFLAQNRVVEDELHVPRCNAAIAQTVITAAQPRRAALHCFASVMPGMWSINGTR